ncbi:MAG: hypothetical protein ABEI97_01730 [Candidatus Nanohaloarchaea archaeon]
MEADTVDFFLQQTFGDDWRAVEGKATRFQHEETGSYLCVNHEQETYEGKVHRPYWMNAGELDTAVQTLEDEGYTGTLSSL